MRHLNREMLAKFAEGGTGLIKAIFIRWHLAKCPECQQILNEIKMDEELLDSIRRVSTRQKEIEREMDPDGKIVEKLVKTLGKSRISTA